ncbi:hypothetical protein BJ912DRAFT_424049 [Pholiota molesta]|nr:hypothetical protein BJ912DRAFT_424049 [Pholiota molesta]
MLFRGFVFRSLILSVIVVTGLDLKISTSFQLLSHRPRSAPHCCLLLCLPVNWDWNTLSVVLSGLCLFLIALSLTF